MHAERGHFARARKARKSKLVSDAPGSLPYSFWKVQADDAKLAVKSWSQPSVKDLHSDLKEPASPSVRLDVGMPDPKRVGGLEDEPAPPTPNAPGSGMETDATWVSVERVDEWRQGLACSARSGEEQPLPLPEGKVSTEEGPRERPVDTESPLPSSSQSEQTDGSGPEQADDGAPEQADDGAPAVRSGPRYRPGDLTLLSLSESASEEPDDGGPVGPPTRVDSLEVHRRRLAKDRERRSPKKHRARVRYCGSRFYLGLYETEEDKNAAIGTFHAALETDRAPRFADAEKRKRAFASLAKQSQEQVGREIRRAEKLKQEKALAGGRFVKPSVWVVEEPEDPTPGVPLPPPTTAVPTHIPLPQVQAEPASPSRDGAPSPLLVAPLSPVSQLLADFADAATPTSLDCSDCTAGTCETCDSCGGTKNMLCGRRSPCLCGWAERQPDFHTAV